MAIRNSATIRAGSLAAALALGACAMAAASRGSEVETLEALRECPKTETVCAPMYANLKWLGKHSDRISDHPAVYADLRSSHNDYGEVIVRIRGRLDGGEPRAYHLKLEYPMDQLGCNDFMVATLTSRAEGGGTILTRQGALEIESSDIIIGSRGVFRLIDPDSGKNTVRLAPGWEKPGWWFQRFIKRDGRVFWRTPNGLCLDIDTDGPFRRVTDEACSGDKPFQASQDDIERVRKMGIFTDPYTIERLKYDLWRLEGAPFLIYIWGVACT